MNVQGHIIIPLERTGEDGISLNISGEQVVFTAGEYFKYATIEAFRGSERIALTVGDITIEGVIENVWRGAAASGGIITVTVERMSDIEVNGTFTYTLTIDGVAYTRTITVSTVLNGENGKDGDAGANAVEYRISASAENIVYFPARQGYTPDTITFTAYQIEGSERSTYTGYWQYVLGFTDGTTTGNTSNRRSALGLSLAGLADGKVVQYVTVGIYDNTPSEGNLLAEMTINTTSQYALREQRWDDCKDGFAFESGIVGCTYLDIVIYGSTNSYYQCRQNHTKSTSTAPQEGTSSEYWQLVNSFDNLATGVLLADYAKINNLYVDDLFMDGTNTAIWINPDLDGMCVAKKESTSALDRGDQNANEGIWATPAVKFHGGTLPTVSDMYGGGATGSATIQRYGTLYELASTADYNVADYETVTYATVRLGTFTKGQLIQLSIESIIGAFTIIEGTMAEESIVVEYSEIALRITLSGAVTTNLVSWIFQGSGVSGDETTFNIDAVSTPVTAASDGDIYLNLVRTEVLARPSTQITMNTNITVNYRINAQGYVSQFASNGVFVGTSSQDYFRLGYDNSGSNTDMEFDMYAGGTGFKMVKERILQTFQNNAMPVGGTLMAGHIVGDGSAVSGTVWTWDGNMPTLSYYGAGYYAVFFPSAWREQFGDMSLGTFAVTVNAIGNSRLRAHVWNESSETSTDGYFEIYVFNENNVATDAPVAFTVQALVGGQAISS